MALALHNHPTILLCKTQKLLGSDSPLKNACYGILHKQPGFSEVICQLVSSLQKTDLDPEQTDIWKRTIPLKSLKRSPIHDQLLCIYSGFLFAVHSQVLSDNANPNGGITKP